MGGLILVPIDPLREQIRKNIRKLKEEEDQETKMPKDLVWAYIGEAIAKYFGVSAEVVRYRLENERLRDEYDDFL